MPSSVCSDFRRSCARSFHSRSGSLVAFPAHPPRLKAAAPFMHFLGQRQQQQHGYGMGGKRGRKETIDGDGKK